MLGPFCRPHDDLLIMLPPRSTLFFFVFFIASFLYCSFKFSFPPPYYFFWGEGAFIKFWCTVKSGMAKLDLTQTGSTCLAHFQSYNSNNQFGLDKVWCKNWAWLITHYLHVCNIPRPCSMPHFCTLHFTWLIYCHFRPQKERGDIDVTVLEMEPSPNTITSCNTFTSRPVYCTYVYIHQV